MGSSRATSLMTIKMMFLVAYLTLPIWPLLVILLLVWRKTKRH